MNDCPFCGEALRALAEMFTESVHETWTREEVVNIIEDAIRMGSPLAGPAPTSGDAAHWKEQHKVAVQKHMECCGPCRNCGAPISDAFCGTCREMGCSALPSSDRGGVGVHRTTESADAPIGQQKTRDAAP